MNTRVLELIKNPKIITESDLAILAIESEKTPYAQSIRALYLFGINLYQPEKYKENLSETAAYTTDKKILYQFINSEKAGKKESLPVAKTDSKETENRKTNTIEEPQKEQVVLPELNSLESKETKEEDDSVKDLAKEQEAEQEVKPSYNISPSVIFTSANNIVYQVNNSNNKTGFPIPKVATQENVDKETKPEEDSKIANAELIEEIEQEETPSLNKFDIEKIIESESQENPEFIVVEGEVNRLLYEGEENFLSEKTPQLDLEATNETGELVLQPESELVDIQIIVDENRSEESMIKDDISRDPVELGSDQDENHSTDDNDISFNGIQDFMPDVKFSVPQNHFDYLNPPKFESLAEKEVASPSSNDTYIEPETKSLEIEDHDGISFSETQAFELSNVEKTAEPEVQEKTQTLEENIITDESPAVTDDSWQPMQFTGNIPDALIGQPKEEAVLQEAIKVDIMEEAPSEIIEEKEEPEKVTRQHEEAISAELPEEELPVINVSFFGDEVSKIEDRQDVAEVISVKENQPKEDSNVGHFINTWQSWLKLDRAEQPTEKVTKKDKIIDNFIETNPKISQLKEENAYVVKERKDDISHLMTETLAKLYTEQKLYTKAIKAYEILANKHPEKKAYFEEKIEEVKDIKKA